MSDIKIFVCCHKPECVPIHPLLYPIQVGAALSDHRFEGFMHDDEGENISYLNRSYCELTAQYWAWKNVDADYYGFFHYRRYLYPNIKTKKIYRINKRPTEKLLDKLGYNDFERLIERYDVIVPKRENMYVPVREHYSNAPYHHIKDLNLIEEIIRENFPQYSLAADEYLSGTNNYFGNIFIMKKQLFYDYCEWLFSILQEFDNRADTSDYGQQDKRVDGYLAERLLGIYFTFHKKTLNVFELPRVHFVANNQELKRKKIINSLIPPGSKRRAMIKGIVANGR